MPQPEKKESGVNQQARHAAALLSGRLRGKLLSVLWYAHPLSTGGLVAVFHDSVESITDLITEAFACVPPDLPLHCLRRSELFELSLPTFALVHILNRRLHLAHCIKREAVVLYGADVRDQVPPPQEPGLLLNLHLESCTYAMRSFNILSMLASGEYLELIKSIDWQAKCLMFTALLVRGEWAPTVNSIQPLFERTFQDAQINALWNELNELRESVNWIEETSCRRSAYEAVWLFECFLRRLRDYAQ